MSPRIIPLSEHLEPELSSPPDERIVSGTPLHSVTNYFTDPSGEFFVGRWGSTPGAWRVSYTETELCVITQGRVVITSDTGERSEFGPGEAFVIPAGFSGTWEVLENCTKIYAIFEPRT